MPLLDKMNLVGTSQPISPEQRMLKNERKRVEGYIRSYQRNPNNWSSPMISSLERLALQYQIPFKREVPTASFAQKAGAFAGGLADAVALDFIPDDWYSSEATRSAKNWGKGIGTAGTIAMTLGGAALARGAAAAGTKAASAMSAKQIAREAARTSVEKGKAAVPFPGKVPGNAAQRRTAKRAHERAPENRATPDISYTSLDDAPSRLGKKFDTANPETISRMAESLGAGAEGAARAAGFTGPGFAARFGIDSVKKGLTQIGQAKGWKFAEKQLTNDVLKAIKDAPGDIATIIGNNKLTKDQVKELSKAITGRYGNKKLGKTLLAEVKGAGTTFSSSSKEILNFVDNIGGIKKVNPANIKKIGNKAGLNSTQIKEITEQLTKNSINDIDDVAKFLINSTKTPSFDPMLLANKDLGLGALSIAGASRPITGFGFGEGLTPSRAQLEAAQDPYDPMNQ